MATKKTKGKELPNQGREPGAGKSVPAPVGARTRRKMTHYFGLTINTTPIKGTGADLSGRAGAVVLRPTIHPLVILRCGWLAVTLDSIQKMKELGYKQINHGRGEFFYPKSVGGVYEKR